MNPAHLEVRYPIFLDQKSRTIHNGPARPLGTPAAPAETNRENRRSVATFHSPFPSLFQQSLLGQEVVITLGDASTRQGTMFNVDPVNLSVALRKVRRCLYRSRPSPISMLQNERPPPFRRLWFFSSRAETEKRGKKLTFVLLPIPNSLARPCSLDMITQVRFRDAKQHTLGLDRNTSKRQDRTPRRASRSSRPTPTHQLFSWKLLERKSRSIGFRAIHFLRHFTDSLQSPPFASISYT